MADDNKTNSTPDPTFISLDQLQNEEKPKPEEPLSPERQDEISVSGSMPDPESDDDTLKNAQAVGLQAGESTEHPEELDISRDINKAKDNQKSH